MTTEEIGTVSAYESAGQGSFTPTAAVLERAKHARAELKARGLGDVWVDTSWWKFEVYMDSQTAMDTATVAEHIGAVVAAALKEPFGTIVEQYVKLRCDWIKRVAAGGAVKLVSPWFAPGMLIPKRAHIEDLSLYWNVYEPANGWSANEKFVGQATAENPALAMYQDKIYCVYRGSHERHLYWTVYDPDGGGWSEGTQLPGGYVSDSSPALAVYGDRLYCVHRGTTHDTLWSTYYNGSTWSTAEQMGTQATSHGPALAVFNNQLYCVYRGAGAQQLYWTCFQIGSGWSAGQPVGTQMTSAEPALAVYENRLYCVYRGTGGEQLYWTRFDGGTWNSGQPIVNQLTSDGPALEVFENQLYCVYKGKSSQVLYWTRFDGNAWTGGAETGTSSGQGPALIATKDKNGTRTQMMCVHRGAS